MKKLGSTALPQTEGSSERFESIPEQSCKRLVSARKTTVPSLDTPFVGLAPARKRAQNMNGGIHSRWTIETRKSAASLQREVLDLLGRVSLPLHHRWAVAISAGQAVQGIIASGGTATISLSVVGSPSTEVGFEVVCTGNPACYRRLRANVKSGYLGRLMDSVELSGHAPNLSLHARKFLELSSY